MKVYFNDVDIKYMVLESARKLIFESRDIIGLLKGLGPVEFHNALEAYRQTYGDAALQNLTNYGNQLEQIANTYYASPTEKQEEFVQRISGTYNDEPIDIFSPDVFGSQFGDTLEECVNRVVDDELKKLNG